MAIDNDKQVKTWNYKFWWTFIRYLRMLHFHKANDLLNHKNQTQYFQQFNFLFDLHEPLSKYIRDHFQNWNKFISKAHLTYSQVFILLINNLTGREFFYVDKRFVLCVYATNHKSYNHRRIDQMYYKDYVYLRKWDIF